MKVGVMGLGRLGIPVAVAIDMHGHDVMGYDIRASQMQKDVFPHKEVGPEGEPTILPFLKKSNVKFASSVEELIRHAEITFVAVQTPHDPMYEGVTRLPEKRIDFNYEWLIDAAKAVSAAADKVGEDKVVVIISTVLPGTVRKQILPLLSPHVKLCYNPFFIAMGTVIRDFLNPEFILFGVHDQGAAAKAEAFYKSIMPNAPFYKTNIENAELIKVAYNTFIGMKVVFVNVLMEICHRTQGTDVDAVTDALKLANRRLISPYYLTAGMGDGGGCHPRDNIALSWLARELHLSYDWFEAVMIARERQTDFLADLCTEQAEKTGLPIFILGKSFKAASNLTTGSPAILLKNLLEEKGRKVEMWDPWVDVENPNPTFAPSVFFVGTRHEEFTKLALPAGSVVLDPWRFIPDQEGVRVIRIGSEKEVHPVVKN